MVYTPGVARVCLAIAENPEDARRLTIKRNTVAVVTDGSAVLGLGNIGPLAALPVMEGKAALFKRFADIDAWPICLDTQDVDEIVRTVERDRAGLRRHQPRGHLGAALLRDRGPAARAARHPGLPRRPARHGDRRARRADATRCGWSARTLAGRAHRDVAAPARPGTAILKLLLEAGAPATSSSPTSTGSSTAGAPTAWRRRALGWIAENTNRRRRHRHAEGRRSPAPTSSSASPRRTSSPATTSPRWRRRASSSRWPTPSPRSTRPRPPEHAAVVATGRSRLPQPDQQRAGLPRRLPRAARRRQSAHVIDDVLLAAARRARRRRRRRRAQRRPTSSRASSTPTSARSSPRRCGRRWPRASRRARTRGRARRAG